MKNSSFFIHYLFNNTSHVAEIKVCCNQEDVWYYDVLIENKYQFTMTPSQNDKMEVEWIVSLKNADKMVEKQMIAAIGLEIEKHMFTIT